MNDLLPCPFCGTADRDDDQIKNLPNWLQITEMPGPLYSVECFGCESTTNYFDSKEEAIEAWNRRVSPWDMIDRATLETLGRLVIEHQLRPLRRETVWYIEGCSSPAQSTRREIPESVLAELKARGLGDGCVIRSREYIECPRHIGQGMAKVWEWADPSRGWSVGCHYCRLSTYDFPTPEEAIEAWERNGKYPRWKL